MDEESPASVIIYIIANTIAGKIGNDSNVQPTIPIMANRKKNFLFPLKSAIVPNKGQTNSAIKATIEETAPHSPVASPFWLSPTRELK